MGQRPQAILAGMFNIKTRFPMVFLSNLVPNPDFSAFGEIPYEENCGYYKGKLMGFDKRRRRKFSGITPYNHV